MSSRRGIVELGGVQYPDPSFSVDEVRRQRLAQIRRLDHWHEIELENVERLGRPAAGAEGRSSPK